MNPSNMSLLPPHDGSNCFFSFDLAPHWNPPRGCYDMGSNIPMLVLSNVVVNAANNLPACRAKARRRSTASVVGLRALHDRIHIFSDDTFCHREISATKLKARLYGF